MTSPKKKKKVGRPKGRDYKRTAALLKQSRIDDIGARASKAGISWQEQLRRDLALAEATRSGTLDVEKLAARRVRDLLREMTKRAS